MTDDVRDEKGRFKPGIGKGFVYKPPSGLPARGMPATGMGWGGKALGTWPGKAMMGLTREQKNARAEEMEDVIYDIAKSEKAADGVKIMAAAKLHEIYQGKPVERVIVDEQPIERDYIDPSRLSPEAREELRAALEDQRAEEGVLQVEESVDEE